MGGGGTTVEAPQPSAEERALQRQQTELLNQQTAILQQNLRQQELLAPFLYKSQGLEPIYAEGAATTVPGQITPAQQTQINDYNRQIIALQTQLNAPAGEGFFSQALGGNNRDALTSQINDLIAQRDAITAQSTTFPGGRQIVGYRELPKTEEEQLQADLEKRYLQLNLQQLEANAANAPTQNEISQLLQQRSLAALKGELPVDPTVTRNLADSEAQLRESLFRNLGPGYETSTPGIQALAEFGKRKQEILAGASRAELTMGEQLGLARQGAQSQSTTDYLNSQQLAQGLRQSRLSNIFNVSQAPAQIGLQGYGQIAQGYNSPIQWYQNQRQQQFNASVANAQGASAGQAGLGQLFGTGLLAAASFFSDPALKSNIKPIEGALEKVKVLRGVTHTWKHAPEQATLGVLSTDVRAVAPELVSRALHTDDRLYDTVDYVHLIPILIEAIKELSDKVERLEAERG